MSSPFWLVWCKGGHMPKRQHKTQESALAEAIRLATLMPGQKFHVLASGESVVNEIKR